MEQPIKDRTGEVKFTATIDAKEDAPIGVRIGLAVQWAITTRADLSWADLSEANLSWANLSMANLSMANLSGADLSRANLSRANLSMANLSMANLSGADLSRADLSWANLSRADLSGSPLQSPRDKWVWAQANSTAIRAVEGRTLILGRRTRVSNSIGSQDYSAPGVYRVPWFSSCPVTECHPGLYLKNKSDWAEGDVTVAVWLDSVVQVGKGIRAPVFLRVEADGFEALGLDCMDADGTIVRVTT